MGCALLAPDGPTAWTVVKQPALPGLYQHPSSLSVPKDEKVTDPSPQGSEVKPCDAIFSSFTLLLVVVVVWLVGLVCLFETRWSLLVLSAMGDIIGLGKIWRFSYLCYKNGGGESYCATSVSPGRRILLPTTLTVLWEVLYIECWS